ncbi:hypothetical protein H0E87_019330 [Populus deltoides]|jgi:hypothetical protein|uniref:Uncharacterized protein n=1 Tax=Populus deltoides TaxID=3696 RepID=A0A8T2XUI8_POPDE|nr:hypothetical protein H0E87_019330 [Populus deltoides]
MASSDVSLEVQYGVSLDKYYKTTQKKREPTIYVSARPCTYANNVAIALIMGTKLYNSVLLPFAPRLNSNNRSLGNVLGWLINAFSAWRYILTGFGLPELERKKEQNPAHLAMHNFCPCNGNKITQFSAPPFRTKNKQRQSVSRKCIGLINACNAWRYREDLVTVDDGA